MGIVDFAPATKADFEAFTAANLGVPMVPPVRCRAYAARVDGRLIGVGGIAFMPDGTRVAFTELTDEARRYPVALHKAALRTLALARELGIKRLVATTFSGHPAAERWLVRLGFAPFGAGNSKVFVHDRL